jgi:hypothetical protein
MPEVSEWSVFVSTVEDLNLQNHHSGDLKPHEYKIIVGCIMDSLSLDYYREHPGLYLLTCLITYSMEQSPSWGSIQFSASQEIPLNLGNPRVHYSIHKSPPHPTSWRSILIFSSHLRLCLPNVLFPSGSPQQNPVYNSLRTHTRYMPHPSYSSQFYHPHNIE